MNLSVYCSMTGCLLALLSFFVAPEAPADAGPGATVEQQLTATDLNCGPGLICQGVITIDLTGAPEDTILTLKPSDVLWNYEENYSSCPGPFYMSVDWAPNVPFEMNEFSINCSVYNTNSKYSIYRGNGDDSCWGYLQIENYPYPQCYFPEQDSFKLIKFYEDYGGENWDVQWDFDQPMRTWYGVQLNEEGLVTALDLDGNPDFKYSSEEKGNNLSPGTVSLHLPALKLLSVANNHLDNAWLFRSNLPELEEFYISNNELQKVEFYEDFDGMPNLRELHIDRNRLSFDDILHSVDTLTKLTAQNGGQYIYGPQKPILLGPYYMTEPGQNLNFSIGVDDTVTTSTYTWYQNGNTGPIFDVRTDNRFVRNNIQYKDRGDYRCHITNPNAPGLTLFVGFDIHIEYPVDCPELLCRDTFEVDMNQVSGDYLTLRKADLLYPGGIPDGYDNCYGEALTFSLFIDGDQIQNVGGTDSINLACSYIKPSFQYAIGDVWQAGNAMECIGIIQLKNLEDYTCKSAETDSLTLVDLFIQTGGPEWTNSWSLNQPMSTWYGVSLNEEGLVECLDLDGEWDCQYSPAGSGNNLTGGAAALKLYSLKFLSLANNQLDRAEIFTSKLPELEELYFSNNQLALIESQQDFSGMPKLRELRIDQNQLSFDDLLWSVEALSARTATNGGSYVYSPQAPIFDRSFTVDSPGQDLTVSLGVDEQVSSNLYTWYKDGHPFQTLEGTNELFLNDISSADAGVYRCEVSNPLAPDLVLTASFELLTDLGCPELVCAGTYTVDMSELPDFSNLSFRLQDLLLPGGAPYTGPCSETPLEFYLSVDDTDFYNQNGSDEITLDCKYFVPTFKYAVEDTLNNSGNNCWGYIQLINLHQFECFGCRTKDSLALVEFYQATGGPNWDHSWDLNQPIDTWYGVGLNDNGCVVCLDLDGEVNCENLQDGNTGNHLVGTLPDLQLPNLRNLSLSHNGGLSGMLPDFSNMPMLEYLELEDCDLSGVIPDFSGLPNLKGLTVSNNELAGTIPDFANIPQLESFAANNNQLEGALPDFSRLPALAVLALQGNQLNGSLPALEGLAALESLSLRDNAFSGALPDFSGKPKFFFLDLAENELTGSIPAFASLEALANIILADNQLNGTIPSFGHLPLSLLDLANNQLSGCVPQLPPGQLYMLNLKNNDLECTTVDFSDYTALKTLIVDGNQFTFEELFALETPGLNVFQYAPQQPFFRDTLILADYETPLTLDLEIDPEVSGNIYTWYQEEALRTTISGNNTLSFPSLQLQDNGNWSCLVTNPALPDLQLRSRSITLQVSPPSCRANDSLALVLFYQVMGGPGWEQGWNLQQPIHTWYGIDYDDELECVIALDLSGNQVRGQLNALRDWHLAHLTRLDLSDNEITGSIPEFTQLHRLQELNLSGNFLKGSLPYFRQQPGLTSLLLADNDLRGHIPAFVHLTALQELHLENNRFTFEDILPNAAQSASASYVPQQPLQHPSYVSALEFDPLTLDLKADEAVASNQYKWYKNGLAWRQLLGNNKLYFDTLSLSDSGEYYCEITNPDVPELVLRTNVIHLEVEMNPLPGTDTDDTPLDPESVPDDIFKDEETDIADGDNYRTPAQGIITARPAGDRGLTFKLFPNPVRGQFTIQYFLAEASVVDLYITDLNGRVVKTICDKFPQKEGDHQTPVAMDHFPVGIYLVHLLTEQDQVHSRLILSR